MSLLGTLEVDGVSELELHPLSGFVWVIIGVMNRGWMYPHEWPYMGTLTSPHQGQLVAREVVWIVRSMSNL